MGRLSLRFVALGYLALILVGPLFMMVWRTVEDLDGAWGAISAPETIEAFKLTLFVAAIAVVVNTVFGIVCALVIVRGNIPGRGLLNAFIDLPLALSPVIVGFSLVVLYGVNGWFGWFQNNGYEILFATPSIVLSTIFVTLPFVAREVVPTLREIGTEQEQAAQTLGASGLADLLAHHAPGDPVGRRLRRRAHRGARDRRVRGGGRGVGQHRRRDADGDAQGRGRLPVRVRQLRTRLRHLLRARGDGDHHPDRDDLPPTEREQALMSISVRRVTKRFDEYVALDDVSVEVATGSLTALLGPSGSGKSTLLRIIAGLETADQGSVFIDGKDVTGRRPQERGVGFVFQHYAAFKHMTVYDNIAFGLKIRKRPKAEIAERVDQLLKLVQLEGLCEALPAQLSGGQRQRMGLARALAIDPAVLLLDEPFGALDARVRAELRDWLRRLHDETHTTTVIVTHDQEEAMDVADQITLMNHARIEQVGSPTELYDTPATEFVMSFVGRANRLGDAWVRPHELKILLDPSDGAIEAIVERDHALRVRREGRAGDRRRRAAGRAAHPRTARRARGRARTDRLGASSTRSVCSHRREACLGLGPHSARRRRPRALDEVCERRPLEHVAHRAAKLEPGLTERRGRAGVGEILRPLPADACDRPLDGSDHIGDRDLRRWAPKRVAAFDATLARHELRVAKLEEDVLEELLRDGLRGRDALALDEPVRGGELEHGPERVIDLGGDPHGASVTRPRRRSGVAGERLEAVDQTGECRERLGHRFGRCEVHPGLGKRLERIAGAARAKEGEVALRGHGVALEDTSASACAPEMPVAYWKT